MNLPEISENLIEQLNHGNTKAFKGGKTKRVNMWSA